MAQRLVIMAVLAILPRLLLAGSSDQSAANAKRKPNFVLIFIDDMGYGDIGPFGSTVNDTPNLNRMAEEGMRLTSFYAAPVCSASRAQLMTGSYAPRVSVPGVFFPAGHNGLHPDELTIAEYLKREDYATTCIGKWHLGDQPPFLPTNQGFDHYFGIPYSNDMQRVAATTGRRVTPLLRDDKVVELLEDEGQRRVTREYTEEAIRFIRSHAAEQFFLYLPHTAMHVPLFPHESFADKSRNGVYGDWVAEVDWSVGEILKCLQQQDIHKRTLVFFTSDNGPWASKGAAGGVAGPLRGSKGSTLEGGVREPAIAWWPGTITPGSQSDEIAGTTDILPTFVSLAGGKLEENRQIDGVDLSALFTDNQAKSPRTEWYYFQGRNLQAVRSGPWKLALTPQSPGMGINKKPADLQSRELRLYNLDEEIGEITNVAVRHPGIVQQLLKLAESMKDDIGSGQPGPGVRPAGAVENPVTLYPTVPGRQRPNKNIKRAAKPVDWSTAKAGDAYTAAAVPQVAGRAFRITLDVSTAAGDGILIAHGGSAVGYAVYQQNENLVFVVRHSSSEINRLRLPKPEHGPVRIIAWLSDTGKMHLTINDKSADPLATGKLLNRQPQEDFCVAHDNKNPLDSSGPRRPHPGTLTKVRLELIR